jgi:hypothetical protein
MLRHRRAGALLLVIAFWSARSGGEPNAVPQARRFDEMHELYPLGA